MHVIFKMALPIALFLSCSVLFAQQSADQAKIKAKTKVKSYCEVSQNEIDKLTAKTYQELSTEEKLIMLEDQYQKGLVHEQNYQYGKAALEAKLEKERTDD